ncbi:type II toxin-antitoxin system RatA family toxin [Streptomyces sp. QL37]|uniref:type II toxin-antitoxin system RatA family toxin n=1 Tax=Streptomyces sp. QL37 TaxID=2093747 RepID=UPI000CF2574A|nr:SRPBCC family protein [Streptomyces sp. QL37]PPQ57558.1 cyclase/dehydrase [Streptomyces sp. QL37]
MPTVQAETLIQDRTPEQVWTLVKDGSLVTSRARHVVSVRPLAARERTFRTSEWTVLLNGSEVTWTQREATGPGLRLWFEQTTGDLESLSGEWSLAPDTAGTRVSLGLTYALGVDGLAPLLDPIWSQSFRAHADELLRALTACAARQRATRA